MDFQKFLQGKAFDAYEYFGAHLTEEGAVFRVYAPNAANVEVQGDFSGWELLPMKQKQNPGVFELEIAGAEAGMYYKYAITSAGGQVVYHCDPYGMLMELRPGFASRIVDRTWKFTDEKWMQKRDVGKNYNNPMNIYELHLGSWKLHEDKTMLSYEEIADELIPYVTDMGYTHVEFLPVMEHPFDGSWGYQVTGYYAATSRFGDPKGLMRLIDRLHQAGIGVILDWVPAHFPRDEIGLRRFDGSCCYEHPDPRRGEMPQWGTCMFDFGRGEVRSFLLSNACFWLDWFHADGLRVDAVSALLYYDFCREQGQWLPNPYGGRENLDAIAFLRKLNATVYHDFPGAMTIAEESSAFPMVTKPAYMGGLGFGFKWNMGWMNDMLAYIKLDPIYRKWHHDKLTFSLFYAFSENYILPFSHDEVVHGKHSMLDKQPGDLWQKFAGLRALYGYTMAHPGKKLLFMGSEFGHFIEWKDDDQLDWFLLVYERHPELQRCVRWLNHLYRETPALWQVDDGWDGFQWVCANDCDNSVVAFLRTDRAGNALLCVTNFTPSFHPIYKVGLPLGGTLEEIFNTDRKEWGGSNQYNANVLIAEAKPWNDLPFSCDICVPPLATVYFRYDKLLPTSEEIDETTTDEAADA